jgi:CheY-like chemotaxis protein/HPt (histidine-containing phosphotransfer) domain-containing protein
LSAGDIPSLLDDQVLGNLHEDFASTGDLGELAVLIRNFLERGGEGVADARAAVESGDAETIRKAAHKLKGSSQTLGANLLGEVAAKVEAAGAADDLETAQRGARELDVVFGLTRYALSDMVDAISGHEPVAPQHAPGSPVLRALLADDEPVALAVLRATTERLGHEPIVATDGQAALGAYERERPQVVITDLQMPGLGGLELARRIREMDGAVPYLVLLSATGERGVGEIGVAVDAVLSKPAREDELRAVLALAAKRTL